MDKLVVKCSLILLAIHFPVVLSCNRRSRPEETTLVSTRICPPDQTSFGSGKKLCYNYGENGDLFYGKCISEYADCPEDETIIAGGLVSDCSDFKPEGFVRCVSMTSRTRICRPVEAKCSSNEIQQPGRLIGRTIQATFGLKIVTNTLIECKNMTPTIRCTSKSDYQPTTVSCISDTEYCEDLNLVRVPSYQLFTDVAECTNYKPSTYIRCVNGALTKCVEFDAINQVECLEPHFTRSPADEIFASKDECSGVNESFDVCYDPSFGLTCRLSDCTTESLPTVKHLQGTKAACLAYCPLWRRYVKTQGGVLCLPLSEESGVEILPSDNAYLSAPWKNDFKTKHECLSSPFFIPCYVQSRNEFDCPDDISGCGDKISVTNNFSIIFRDWADCIEYLTPAYTKCVNLATGEVNCRPQFAGCADNETLTYESDSSNVTLCQQGVPYYFYCFDEEHPTERECVMDYIGCSPNSTELRYREDIQIFHSEQACLDHSPEWKQCKSIGQTPKPTNTNCRPVEIGVDDPCILGEELVSDKIYEFLDDCIENLPQWTELLPFQ